LRSEAKPQILQCTAYISIYYTSGLTELYMAKALTRTIWSKDEYSDLEGPGEFFGPMTLPGDDMDEDDADDKEKKDDMDGIVDDLGIPLGGEALAGPPNVTTESKERKPFYLRVAPNEKLMKLLQETTDYQVDAALSKQLLNAFMVVKNQVLKSAFDGHVCSTTTRVAAAAYIKQRFLRGSAVSAPCGVGPDGVETFDVGAQEPLAKALKQYRIALENWERLSEDSMEPSILKARREARDMFEELSKDFVNANFMAMNRLSGHVEELLLDYTGYVVTNPNVNRIKVDLLGDPKGPKMLPVMKHALNALSFVKKLNEAMGAALSDVDKKAMSKAEKSVREGQTQIGVKAIMTCVYVTFPAPTVSQAQKEQAAKLTKEQIQTLNILVPLSLRSLLEQELAKLKAAHKASCASSAKAKSKHARKKN
jgi:hypothetical protein